MGLLETYIRSRTKNFNVENIERYQMGGIAESLCPFCDDIHDDHIITSDNIDTGTHACDRCFNIYSDMLNVKKRDTVSHQTKQEMKEVLFSVLDEDTYSIPIIITKHLHHLYPKHKDVFAGMQTFCFICQREMPITMYNQRHLDLLEIPVKAGSSVGGYIGICDRDFCDGILDEYNKELRVKTDKGYFKSIECPTCRNYYHIDLAEYDYRKKQKFTTFECAVCTYQKINKFEAGHHYLFPGVFGEERTSHFDRHKEIVCDICGAYDSVDLMQSAFSLAFAYDFRNKPVCSECGALRQWFEVSTVFRIIQNEPYFIEIYNQMSFSLFSVLRGTLTVLIGEEPLDLTKHILERTSIAIEECYNYLVKQSMI